MPATGPSPEIKYSNSTAQKLFRVSISEPSQRGHHHTDPQYAAAHSPPQSQSPPPPGQPHTRRASSVEILPEVGFKWGKSPEVAAKPKASGQAFAEERKKKEKKSKGGFWEMVAGTGSGRGVIN